GRWGILSSGMVLQSGDWSSGTWSFPGTLPVRTWCWRLSGSGYHGRRTWTSWTSTAGIRQCNLLVFVSSIRGLKHSYAVLRKRSMDMRYGVRGSMGCIGDFDEGVSRENHRSVGQTGPLL